MEDLKHFEMVNIDLMKIKEKKTEIWGKLRVKPWSFNFIIGRIGEPVYSQIIQFISGPSAARIQLISDGERLIKSLNYVIIISRLLMLGGLVLVCLFFVNLYFILIGMILFALWYFVFNNIRVILNVEIMARLVAYEDIAGIKGNPIILGIQD